MKFLDLTGVQSLWNAIKAETAKSKTTVEGQSVSATNAYISVTGAEVTGSGADGHTNYVVSIVNAASPSDVTAAKEALYGGTVPSSNALTLEGLDDRIDGLSTSSTVTVEELSTPETGYLKSYAVKQNGSQVGATINIPKDFLVKSGSVRDISAAEATQQMPEGTKVLDFVINTISGDGTDSHVIIPVTDLVDVYTEGDGIDISSSNVVSAVVDSAANGNEFLSVSSNGLKVSGVSSAIATAKSEVIGASTDAASANTVYGAKAYADSLAGDYATATQGATADTALQSISKGTDGNYVTTTIGTKSNNNQTVAVSVTTASVATSGTTDGLATAADVKSYVDSTVSTGTSNGAHKVASATAGNLAGLDSNGDLTDSGYAPADFATAAQGTKADSAIQSVKVNGSALTPDANKAVDVLIAEGATNGTIAVNGTDVAVHGLGSAAYTDSTAYATSTQGGKADTAIQGVTGETDITGGNSTFVAVTASEDSSHEVTLASKVKTQAVASASSSAQGLAEASDVKDYVDNKFSTGAITIASHTETATGTAQNSGTFVVSSVTTQNGGVTAVGSVEVEAAGAAAAVRTALVGDATTSGDTLGELEDRIEALEAGAAVESLDYSVNGSSTVNVTSTNTNTTTSASASPTVNVLTGFTVVDGVATAATAETIGAITASELQAIFSGE